MTTPNIVPAKYTGVVNPYLICKADRGGPERTEAQIISIPSGTIATTIVGLVPFRAGAEFNYGSTIFTDDLDTATNVTYTLGYIYDLGGTTVNGVTYTNAPAAFGTGLSGQTAAQLLPNVPAGVTFKALGDGWIALTVSGGPTTTTGNISCQITLAYDQQ